MAVEMSALWKSGVFAVLVFVGQFVYRWYNVRSQVDRLRKMGLVCLRSIPALHLIHHCSGNTKQGAGNASMELAHRTYSIHTHLPIPLSLKHPNELRH